MRSGASIITGAGERAFCAGSDIGELDRYDTPWNFRNRPDYCDAIRRLLKPTIAAVNGYAFGGGLETAMSCDIRIASDTAQFAAPEIKLGWIGGGGMATFLAHSIGPSNAAMMIMTGDPIPASQALGWGLVSEVVPQADLLIAQPGDCGHHRRARPDRGGDGEAQSPRRLHHAAREGDRIRTRPADDLLRHRGRRRRARGVQGEAPAGVPEAMTSCRAALQVGDNVRAPFRSAITSGVVPTFRPAMTSAVVPTFRSAISRSWRAEDV